MLLCDLRAVRLPLISAPAQRFAPSDAVKGQNPAFVPVQGADAPLNRPRLKHRTAPAHHAARRPDHPAQLFKILFLIAGRDQRCPRMRPPEPLHIFIGRRKLQCRVSENMHQLRAAQSPCGKIRRHRRILSPAERDKHIHRPVPLCRRADIVFPLLRHLRKTPAVRLYKPPGIPVKNLIAVLFFQLFIVRADFVRVKRS